MNRIKIDQATGDVIDVGYLDTTLWEFGGDLLSTDHPSGRVIRFPNSKVLNSVIYNYSWLVKRGSSLFFGHSILTLLEKADCSMLIVSS